MKSKKKKRLLILIGVMFICLLPISFLSKALVPWADELGEVTTEVGASPPGEATATDAVTDVGKTLLADIRNGSIQYADLTVEQATQVVEAILADKEQFDWFCELDDTQAKKIFGVDKERIQFEFEILMKDNTDMSFVKDMSVEDYDKFFGTTDGKTVISTVMSGKTVDATAAADGGFWMTVEGCAPGHEGIIPLGKYYVTCIHGGYYISGQHLPPYGSMNVKGRTLYVMCGNNSLSYQSFFAFSTASIEKSRWSFSVAYPNAAAMYFDYYKGAEPDATVPSKAFHDALGKLMEANDTSYNGVSYACPGSWDNVITSARYKVINIENGEQLSDSSLIKMSVLDGQQRTSRLRFETGTSYFGTNITVPVGTSFHYYLNGGEYDAQSGQTISVPNGTEGYFYAPLSTNGTLTASTASAGSYIETVYRFECTTGATQLSSGNNLPVQQIVCPITARPTVNINIQAEATSHVTLKKTSSNPNCSSNNPLYDLAGTQYTIYNQDGTPATTIAGTPAVLTCKSDGTTNSLELPIGNYKVKETKVGKGYLKNVVLY